MYKIKTILTIVAILGNIVLSMFAIFLSLRAYRASEVVILALIILLLFTNVYLLINLLSSLIKKAKTGFISLYFKRKALEETLKIKELEAKIK